MKVIFLNMCIRNSALSLYLFLSFSRLHVFHSSFHRRMGPFFFFFFSFGGGGGGGSCIFFIPSVGVGVHKILQITPDKTKQKKKKV